MFASGWTDYAPLFFFFNDTATTEIYTLSLHDALPIYARPRRRALVFRAPHDPCEVPRSEEHTSELQSRQYLVCRLLLEKNRTHRKFGEVAGGGELDEAEGRVVAG